MCKLNPKIDLVFKKVFGTEQNKNILKSLINSVLPQEEQIVALTLKNPYNEQDFLNDKLSIVDIKATDENGNWYDIEIQVKEQKFYGKRAIFYHSEIYGNQLSQGDSYDELHKTIIISILDFNYFKQDKRYFRRCCYKDFDTGEFYSELDYADLYFIELNKFDNDLKNVKTTLDRWVTFLNKAVYYERETIPKELQAPEIVQAFDTIEHMGLNTKEQEYYRSAQKVMRDRKAELLTAIENAREEGMEEGIEKGMEKGREEGREEGMETKAIEIATKMLRAGVEINIVSETTGLSKKQIEELVNI